jgi:HNH endonuclease
MSALDRYPWWPPGTPHTDSNARVYLWRTVRGVRAVRITNGRYRNAPVTDVFELFRPDRNDPIEVLPSGKKQVQVICAWYGGKPNKKSGARIDVTSSGCRVQVPNNFSGQVADSIGRPTDAIPPSHDGSLFPEEVPTSESYWEGATRRITVNAYERDATARRACIAHFGTVCSVCRFDFAARYGELGRGFIHVHHTRPLSEIRAGYAVDPKRDLIPVCPNCHAMIHRPSPQLTIAQLQKRLRHATRKA